jgi:hypothetical protein
MPLIRPEDAEPIKMDLGVSGTQLTMSQALGLPETPALVAKVAPARTRIAFVGTAPSREEAPFGDPSWEIWVCSAGNAYNQVPRVEQWFEMHGDLEWEQYKEFHDPYLKWLNEQAFPVYMQKAFCKLVPRATPYPIEDMVREFGPDWFTSTICYMFASATVRLRGQPGAEIGLWGIDMEHDTEYADQLPAIKFWQAIIAGFGIKPTLPLKSSLNNGPPLYGYHETDPMVANLSARAYNLGRKKIKLQGEVAEILAQVQALENAKNLKAAEMYFLDGAIDNTNYMLRSIACRSPFGK